MIGNQNQIKSGHHQMKKNKESNKKNTKTDKSKSKVEKKTIFHKKSDAGKGDVPRRGISVQEWADRWDKIFGIGRHRKEKTEKN